MNIYEALKKDHTKLKGLLADLVAAEKKDNKARNALIAKIRDELVPHSRAEEAVFYNSLREIDSAKSLVFHGYAEHLEAEAVLRSLQMVNSLDMSWIAGAQKLKEDLEHHISEEEGKVFTAAKNLFTAEEAEMMGAAFEKMKPEIREGSFMQNTVDMVANIMPDRLRGAIKGFTTHVNGK